CCAPAWSTSTAGEPSTRPPRSAASAPRASAASTAATVSAPTWGARRFGRRCRGLDRRRHACQGSPAVTRTLSAVLPARPKLARSQPGATAKRWTAPLAGLCGLVLVAATVEIVLDASLGHSPLIPKSPPISSWLRSLGGERLGYRTFLIAILSSCVAYGVLLALAHGRARASEGRPPSRRAARCAIGLVALLDLIVFAGPILI